MSDQVSTSAAHHSTEREPNRLTGGPEEIRSLLQQAWGTGGCNQESQTDSCCSVKVVCHEPRAVSKRANESDGC